MEFIIRPFRPGEEKYVANLHERLYSNEYGWGPGFIDYAKAIALEFPERRKPPKDELWVAETSDGELVGSVMLCATDDPEVGQLRLFAVEKHCRRQGIGSALMAKLFEQAREIGFKKLILWTAAPLEAAIRGYERAGFQVVESSENTNWCTDGSSITEIKMEMTL